MFRFCCCLPTIVGHDFYIMCMVNTTQNVLLIIFALFCGELEIKEYL